MERATTPSSERLSRKVPTMREDILSPLEVQKEIQEISVLDASLAADRLEAMDSQLRVLVLRSINPAVLDTILPKVTDEKRETITNGVPPHIQSQWELNRTYPEGSVGRLMDPPVAIFQSDMTVNMAKVVLRDLVQSEFITYAYAVDPQERLVGVIVMRDLLFAQGSETLEEIMLSDPFYLKPEQDVMEAMKDVVLRHFPVYPVCDEQRRIKGLVRGYRLFESQAYEITAQVGTMVAVSREEHTSTPWWKSFLYRHPWLQLNLLTAFVAGAVVSIFQETIDKMVILAAFLPVLAGQSGNTGCQALAVTLRGLTLGELKPGETAKNVRKEALLGFLNGALVGISAGVGMYILARSQGNPDAFVLSVIVVMAMIGSCLISGISGTLVPLALKKIGADPATASSIFLTTATDVASMGMLLGLATWVLL